MQPEAAHDADSRLREAIASFRHDPLGFVYFAFSWGQGPLKDKAGPEPWQAKVLSTIGELLAAGASVDEAMRQAIRIARRSGHGIGKSALVAWIILWAMSTFPDCRGTATANTEAQLRTKTTAELAKWYRLCLTRDWFKLTATAIYSADPAREKTWRVDLVPWSEANTEAFAGLHNEGKRVLMIFDEASAIPDTIWDVAEGAMTDATAEIIWCAFGNPTMSTGRFVECFGKLRHRWDTDSIDSRSVSFTNQEQFRQWAEDWGEDSDFFRVRVRGLPPRIGSVDQFVSSTIIASAYARQPGQFDTGPSVMGVDVARFGDDESVVLTRNEAAVVEVQRFRELDLMELSTRVANLIDLWKPQSVFVDEVGLGAGVVDRLRQLGHEAVIGVNNAAKATESEKFANLRVESWSKMRDWLKARACLPAPGAEQSDTELGTQIKSVAYAFDDKSRLILEKKKDLKARGLPSPDLADALALTFAQPVNLFMKEWWKYDEQPQEVPDWEPDLV